MHRQRSHWTRTATSTQMIVRQLLSSLDECCAAEFFSMISATPAPMIGRERSDLGADSLCDSPQFVTVPLLAHIPEMWGFVDFSDDLPAVGAARRA